MRLPFFGQRRKQQESAPTASLEREGQEWLNRITGALRTEPWLVTLLKLAWTAGPATLLAASLGYYFGFGKSAPLENLRFFFAYTIIFGVVGLAAGIFARATYGKRREIAEKNLLLVADYLPDLIMATRDLHLATLEPEVRRLEAVGLLLQRVDLDTGSLVLAIEELGASQAVAKAAGKIDMYRLAGLSSRTDELVADIAEQAQPVITAVAEWAPHVGNLLRDRLNGRAPSFNDGIARDNNFLERVLSAMEREDDQLMTLLDAEEVLVLACELINGRRIPMLLFSYRGRHDLVEATERLERPRTLYRIDTPTQVRRLKALVALLGESDALEAEGATRGLQPKMMWSRAQEGIEALQMAIAEGVIDWPTASTEQRQRLRRMLETLRSALKLSDDMNRAVRRANRRHTLFLRTAEKWTKQTERIEGLEMRLTGARLHGFQVLEKHIQLTNEEALELAAQLAGIFREWGVTSVGDRLLYRHGSGHRTLNPEIVKELAKEVAAALQPFVDITQPEVQRAIDASPATNLLGLELGLSARTKAAWGSAAAHEVEEHLAQAAEHLAATLVTNYRVTLTESAMGFLHDHYGARLDRLRTLNSRERLQPATPSDALLARSPLSLEKDAGWKRTLDSARSLLKRYEHLREGKA